MGGTTVEDADVAPADTSKLLVSHTGHVLSRNRAFRFAADLSVAQSGEFFMCAGALGGLSIVIGKLLRPRLT